MPKNKKKNNTEGFIEKEEEWLLTKYLLNKETIKSVVNDAPDRDEKSCHYHSEMDVVCEYCKELWFCSE